LLTRNILFKLSIFFISLKSYAYKEFDLKLIHSEDFDHTLLDDTTEDGIDIIAHLTPDQ
jgi:hypothetical protein